MSENRWTPGPWLKGRYGDLTGSDGKTVKVYDAGLSWVMCDPNEVHRANANLISVAPELYEALYNVVYWSQQVQSTFGNRDANDKAINNQIAAEKTAMDVLAKARGEQPK